MPDQHKNLAISAVATAPSPAASGTSLVVTAGHGVRFPTAPFNAVMWPATSQPDPSNAEIVRVTTVATDTLTIARTQEGTTARTVVVGDQIAAGITAKTLTDVEGGTRPFLPGQRYIPIDGMTSMVYSALPLNELAVTPMMVPAGTVFDQIGINVNTAGATALIRLGLYTMTSGYPTTLIVDAGTVDGSTTGDKTLTISYTMPVTGLLGLAHAHQTAVCTIRGALGQSPWLPQRQYAGSLLSQADLMAWTDPAVSGAFPANFTTTKVGRNSAPLVILRAA